jgi:hypothetical protein
MFRDWSLSYNKRNQRETKLRKDKNETKESGYWRQKKLLSSGAELANIFHIGSGSVKFMLCMLYNVIYSLLNLLNSTITAQKQPSKICTCMHVGLCSSKTLFTKISEFNSLGCDLLTCTLGH